MGWNSAIRPLPGCGSVRGGKAPEGDLDHIRLAGDLKHCLQRARVALMEAQMNKLTPFRTNGSQKLCFGCGEPFPIRHGHIEALVGQDGQLYCYAGKAECAELAVRRVPLKRAA
jgi:hypothetical protein